MVCVVSSRDWVNLGEETLSTRKSLERSASTCMPGRAWTSLALACWGGASTVSLAAAAWAKVRRTAAPTVRAAGAACLRLLMKAMDDFLCVAMNKTVPGRIAHASARRGPGAHGGGRRWCPD